MRTERRLKMWMEKDGLLEPQRFCTVRFISQNLEERSMLYRGSLEFIRYLDLKHGEDDVNLIVDDVRRGVAFKDSIRRRLGGECNELYRDWIASF